MAIKDLQAREGNVDLIATVEEIGNIREFEKFGKKGRVASATIKDDTGTMKLTLWNEQVDQISIGAKIHVQKGYVNEFQGELQLTTGKFGTLDVLEEGQGKAKEGLAAFVPEEKPTPVEPPKEEVAPTAPATPQAAPSTTFDTELDNSDVEEEHM